MCYLILTSNIAAFASKVKPICEKNNDDNGIDSPGKDNYTLMLFALMKIKRNFIPHSIKPETGVSSPSVRQGVSFVRRLVVLAVIAMAIACSRQQESGKPAVPNPYEGWKYFTSENVRIFYPPGHPNEAQFPEVCSRYVDAIRQVTEKLGMEPYTDTLLVIYYSGWGSGREITGREYPFGTDSAIHLWLPSFPGPTLMQHLLPRWVPLEPRSAFLKHGLIALFDFSGQNYHLSTIRHYNQGKFIGLADLAADTTVNSNIERYQSAEAASFVAFCLAQAGEEGIRALYASQLPFEQSSRTLFGLEVDSLETLWLRFVRLNVPSDSIHDSL